MSKGSPRVICRVRPGSALERALRGRSVTDAIHELAERVEAMQREPQFNNSQDFAGQAVKAHRAARGLINDE